MQGGTDAGDGRGRAARERACGESGIALVMALGVVLALTVALTSIITFAASGSRDATRNAANHRAQALSEAGLNHGLAHLTGQYPSAQKAGNGGGSLAGGPVTDEGGTFSWTGTFDAASEQWEVTGTATVQNPTGPGAAPIVRSASAKVAVVLAAPWAKFGLYSANPGAGCTTLKGSINVNVPVYIASCLELGGNTGGAPAKIWEPNDPPTVTVHVGGQLSASPLNPAIGTAADPVQLLSAGSCVPAPCAAPRFNATSYPSLPLLLEPKVNAQLEYDKAQWSSATCAAGSQPFDNDAVRNNSRGTFDLLALPSYDCTAHSPTGAEVGRLAWNSTTKQLLVEGTIYLDGNLAIGVGSAAQYSGSGTVYVNGTVDVKGIVCGPGSTFSPSAPSCSMEWNPDLGNLLIVAANTQAAQVPGAPILRYAEPESDGAANAWTKSAGAQGWSLLDDRVRQPAVPSPDHVSSLTNGQQQDVVFANMTHDPTATYRVRLHSRKGNRRGLQTLVSTDDTTFGSAVTHSNDSQCSTCPAEWFFRTVAISSQAELDGLRLRLVATGAHSSGPTPVEVHAAYLEQSVPTYTTDCATGPSDTGAIAFSLSSAATRLEAGAWAVGTFTSTGHAELGGSVFTEGCSAIIEGGGTLKAFISLPSGAPSMFTLAERATDFR